MGDEHDHAGYEALRVKALESLLVEKGLLASDAIDRIVAAYEQDIGPLNGAHVVARAWVDPAFKERLLEDATAAIRELGIGGLEGEHMVALENTPTCTTSSCARCARVTRGPARPAPDWYKSPAYRSRIVVEPRTVLAEIGLEWTSRSRCAYGTRARRSATSCSRAPRGHGGPGGDELAALVTRDAMIGVAKSKGPV